MRLRHRTTITTAALTLAAALAAPARAADLPATITVDAAHPGVAIPPVFYGLMTEEINHSYDGGLYAELVRNRTFQDDAKVPAHWALANGSDPKATIGMDHGDPVNGYLPVSLRLNLAGGRAGVANDGYWGVPVKPDTTYTASFYAKGGDGFDGLVTASIVTDDGHAAVATADSPAVTGEWKRYTVTLHTGPDAKPTTAAKFVLAAQGKGTVWFSLVSLFPPTYKDAPNGLRPDLMQLMAGLHPAFIRLPGGNYLEGNDFPNRFSWKQMIGPIDQRPGHQCCWGYRSTDGFGLPEYLRWCQQLDAQPLLAVFAGYTLNHDHIPAGPALEPYVQEALEEIEYVSGGPDTKWGKRRAADGFPEPFKLTYVEIGNEDWFDGAGSYDGRFAQFAKAIRAKYPDLKLIATAPVKTVQPDLVDDHYYRTAREMAGDWDHYAKLADGTFGAGHTTGASADAAGPKIFVGEWATQEGRPTPDLNAGLADAVWLMGLERTADVVPMECYAPLLVNVNPGAWQWPTNLIGYDASHSFGSPSYYAQAMLGQHKGDTVLPAAVTLGEHGQPATPVAHGGVGVGVWHTDAQFTDVTVTAPGGKKLVRADPAQSADGWRFTGDKWAFDGGTAKPGVADAETWATVGDPSWTDYTLTLKARKTAGREGFLILYHAADSDHFGWWNVGGWGNTATQFQQTDGDAHEAFGPRSNFTVQPDRWYDVKLVVQGRHVRGYIDGKLISDATAPAVPRQPSFYATATRATHDEQVILKAVNMGADPVAATVNLTGAGTISPDATAYVLTGDPKDVNTIDEPKKISPTEEQVSGVGPTFKRTFPPHSLTLMVIKAGGK